MIKHAIFDLDGTLLNSMPDWYRVSLDYLKNKNIFPPPEMVKRIARMTVKEFSAFICREYGIEMSPTALFDECSRIMRKKYETTIEPKPYAIDFLSLLKQHGIKICIATATDREICLPAIKRLGIDEYIEFLITCTEAGANKTTPQIYLKAMEKLGGTLENTVVFEDALHCIKTVKSAGFYTIGISDETTKSDSEEIRSICDRYISSYYELIP